MNENETTRYAQFCQFRKEIRGSQDYLIVGIDVAKDKHHAFFGTATGQSILRRLIFDNNASGFSTLVERADQFMRQFKLKRVVYRQLSQASRQLAVGSKTDARAGLQQIDRRQSADP